MLYFFFFNDTATTEIYTLSLHDALPICVSTPGGLPDASAARWRGSSRGRLDRSILLQDRKSTRLNSSHSQISYAVFCLKKKTTPMRLHTQSHSNKVIYPSPPSSPSPITH